jgi:hypothetical protein
VPLWRTWAAALAITPGLEKCPIRPMSEAVPGYRGRNVNGCEQP